MNRRRFMPMLEADGGAGGGTGDGGSGASSGSSGGDTESGGDGGEQTSGASGDLSFDDYLKQGNNQAEFDRRLSKGIETAVSKERERMKALADDNLNEAEKLAKMNDAERQKYLAEKKDKEIADREAEITRRELSAEAKETLAGKGLPAELSEILNYTDAESCKASIETVEKTFNAAVEKAVKEKLKGGRPPADARTKGETNLSQLEKESLNAMKGTQIIGGN